MSHHHVHSWRSNRNGQERQPVPPAKHHHYTLYALLWLIAGTAFRDFFYRPFIERPINAHAIEWAFALAAMFIGGIWALRHFK